MFACTDSASTTLPETAQARLIDLITFDRFQSLDLTGPQEVFAQANRFLTESGDTATLRYRIRILSPNPDRIVTSSGGLRILADGTLDDGNTEIPCDTLMVVGGAGIHALADHRPAVAWIAAQADRARRIASVCTGTFALARAGLLEGRRVTTHWRSAALLAERYPTLQVDPDAIWIKDGPFYSSAGVTAGMDLALALVEEDCGPAIALEIARNLVLYLRRSGGQSQFSAHLLGQMARTAPIRTVQGWILDNLDRPMAVPDLAERVAMSPRNFSRVFLSEIGIPPGRFVERARVDAARGALGSPEPIGVVAAKVGFSTPEAMRRAFVRHLGVTPQDYRERFAATA